MTEGVKGMGKKRIIIVFVAVLFSLIISSIFKNITAVHNFFIAFTVAILVSILIKYNFNSPK